ncbi:recombinase family protein [Streptomyces sp. NPDC020096]
MSTHTQLDRSTSAFADDVPLAFIYDRNATANKGALQIRLAACARYAAGNKFEIGGWFLDTGDEALTNDHRPAFEALLNTLRAAATGRPCVCLVYDWERISREEAACGLFTGKVLQRGGWVETCFGEKRTPDGRYVQVGRLSSAPITA